MVPWLQLYDLLNCSSMMMFGAVLVLLLVMTAVAVFRFKTKQKMTEQPLRQVTRKKKKLERELAGLI